MNVVNRPGELAAGNPLKQMEAYGQSPWLDFIQRSFIGPKLQEIIDRDGLKGITSNPAIFEKAMGHGTDYDEGFKALAAKGDLDALDVYEALAVQDIQAACDMMLPVYEATVKSTAMSASRFRLTSRCILTRPLPRRGGFGSGSTART